MEEFKLTNDPTEAELVDMAMRQPLEFKIERAIALLRQFEPADGYHLAYSGGKDSGVILELATMAGVKFTPVYNVVTIDPPELVRFIKKHHPEVVFHRQPVGLFRYMVDNGKGLPVRHLAWCCQVYKDGSGAGKFRVLGVRVDESDRRAKMWKLVVPQRDGTAFVCPICYWTEKDVWDFHKLRNLPYCSLYDEGFTRLGCVGCPRAGNQLAEFERWPLMGRNWKRAVKAFYEKWEHVPSTKTGKTRFFVNPRGWEGYWEWWITQKWPTSCQLEFLFADVNKEEFE